MNDENKLTEEETQAQTGYSKETVEELAGDAAHDAGPGEVDNSGVDPADPTELGAEQHETGYSKYAADNPDDPTAS